MGLCEDDPPFWICVVRERDQVVKGQGAAHHVAVRCFYLPVPTEVEEKPLRCMGQ